MGHLIKKEHVKPLNVAHQSTVSHMWQACLFCMYFCPLNTKLILAIQSLKSVATLQSIGLPSNLSLGFLTILKTPPILTWLFIMKRFRPLLKYYSSCEDLKAYSEMCSSQICHNQHTIPQYSNSLPQRNAQLEQTQFDDDYESQHFKQVFQKIPTIFSNSMRDSLSLQTLFFIAKHGLKNSQKTHPCDFITF